MIIHQTSHSKKKKNPLNILIPLPSIPLFERQRFPEYSWEVDGLFFKLTNDLPLSFDWQPIWLFSEFTANLPLSSILLLGIYYIVVQFYIVSSYTLIAEVQCNPKKSYFIYV